MGAVCGVLSAAQVCLIEQTKRHSFSVFINKKNIYEQSKRHDFYLAIHFQMTHHAFVLHFMISIFFPCFNAKTILKFKCNIFQKLIKLKSHLTTTFKYKVHKID